MLGMQTVHECCVRRPVRAGFAAIRQCGRKGPAMRRALVIVVVLAAALTACGRSDSSPGGGNYARVDAAHTARELLPGRYREEGVLKVVTSVGYPPMEMYAPGTTRLTGVDPDLAHAIAEELGLRLELSNAAFDGIVPGVQGQRWDLALSSLSDSAKRRAAVDFVDYFRAGGVILVRKGNPEHIRGLGDLCGKSVVLAQGSSNLKIGQEQNARCRDGMRISQSVDAPSGLLTIDSGRTVATIVDYPAGIDYAKTGKYELIGGQHTAGLWGIAVSKHNDELRDAVQKALGELIADGRYATILRRYGVEANAIPTPKVNTK